METTTQIVIEPHGDGGYRVSVDRVEIAKFTAGGQAACEFALKHLECVRLRKIIDDHASWLCSRTPDQVSDLTACKLREIGQELRFQAGIKHA